MDYLEFEHKLEYAETELSYDRFVMAMDSIIDSSNEYIPFITAIEALNNLNIELLNIGTKVESELGMLYRLAEAFFALNLVRRTAGEDVYTKEVPSESTLRQCGYIENGNVGSFVREFSSVIKLLADNLQSRLSACDMLSREEYLSAVFLAQQKARELYGSELFYAAVNVICNQYLKERRY